MRTDKSQTKKGMKSYTYERWYKCFEGCVCAKCYDRLVIAPTKPFNILFKRNAYHLKENPRKGRCERCGKIGKTELHHMIYGKNPLEFTIEVCRRCHIAIHKARKLLVKNH